jgi:trehalose 6-phosphate phosphatase
MIDLHTILLQQPLGLVFDIDGTLSPIAPTPAEARLHPGVCALLEKAAQYAHVAIMTGRSIEDGAAMVNVEGLTYVGNHGAEWSTGLPSTHQVQFSPETMAYIEPAAQILDLAEKKLSHIPGLIIDRKRMGGAVHYRQTADNEQTRLLILDTLSEPTEARHLQLSEGKKVIEIKPTLVMNKGVALRRLVQQYNFQGVIFAGDDRTDLDAILEIGHLKQEGIAAASIVVQHHDTLSALLENADVIVQEVDGMVQLLRNLVEHLEN